MPLPLVHPLPTDFSLVAAFQRLRHLPGCLWLDSAPSGPPVDAAAAPLGRYSFLCADPVARFEASAADANPWPRLRQWAGRLPQTRVADLPPFQGGIAGLWGYEAAVWLEDIGTAASDDLPTPALSVGLYDWVIAHDAHVGRSWVISQGLSGEAWQDGSPSDPADEFQADESRARRRLSEVLRLLADADEPDPSPPDAPPRWAAAPPAAAPPAASLRGSYATAQRELWSNFSSAGYRAAVAEIVARIGRGDVFQVNLAQRLVTPATCDAATLYLRLRQANPAPLAGFYDGGTFQVASSSPEGFLRLRQGLVETRPIKGTVARTGDAAEDAAAAAALLASEKDRAENVMIVDLMRSDLSRVCEDASVVVTQLCRLESYAFVQHLVSVVQGRLRPDCNAIDLLAACFPGGSITGAPKIEATRTIAALEPHRRGPYCGSLGYISCGGDAEFNILIRTVTASGGWWQIPVGGGITARSEPQAEERETWIKAEGMLRAVRGGIMRR